MQRLQENISSSTKMPDENDNTNRRQPLSVTSSMHVEIDIELLTEGDGEVFTTTPDMVFDQLKHVIEKLQHKKVKISFKMVMTPSIEESTTKRAEG